MTITVWLCHPKNYVHIQVDDSNTLPTVLGNRVTHIVTFVSLENLLPSELLSIKSPHHLSFLLFILLARKTRKIHLSFSKKTEITFESMS